MTPSSIDTVASALIMARCGHRPHDAAPLAGKLASAADAYAVQERVAREFGWFADGGAPRYWKSGGPSREAMPTHAPLPPAGVWTSPAHGGAWPFHMRGIEAEIALRLACEVDAARAGRLGAESAAELVDAMAVSIELVDSRWQQGLDAPALFKLADLQSHGALVLGEWMPFDLARDWRAQSCRVRIGAQAAVERTGTHAMNDPAFVLAAWLRHATRDGACLQAGTVVTTGTWVGILHAAAGDLVTAEFAGIGCASVQL